ACEYAGVALIAQLLGSVLVRGVEHEVMDGRGQGVAAQAWRRFLSDGKHTRLEASAFCSAGILPAFSESAAGWKPPLRNSSVPTQGQSRKPAFCGFSWTYRMILDSDASLRTKWSKYSRCQKLPERPKRRFAPWAENDFQECRMASNLRSPSVENTTCT